MFGTARDTKSYFCKISEIRLKFLTLSFLKLRVALKISPKVIKDALLIVNSQKVDAACTNCSIFFSHDKNQHFYKRTDCFPYPYAGQLRVQVKIPIKFNYTCTLLASKCYNLVSRFVVMKIFKLPGVIQYRNPKPKAAAFISCVAHKVYNIKYPLTFVFVKKFPSSFVFIGYMPSKKRKRGLIVYLSSRVNDGAVRRAEFKHFH